MKQEVSVKIEPKTGEIPDWVKKGIPDWFWIAIIIVLSLLTIVVRYDELF